MGQLNLPKKKKRFKVDQCGICKLVLVWKDQHFIYYINLLSCKMINNNANALPNSLKDSNANPKVETMEEESWGMLPTS